MSGVRGTRLAGLGVLALASAIVLPAAAPAATVETHPVTNGGPSGIVAGPGNTMTVVARDCAYVGSFDIATAGFSLIVPGGGPIPCTPGAGPSSVVLGPDGRIYFTLVGTGSDARIASVASNGSGYAQSAPMGATALDLTTGSDGNVWFTVNGPPGKLGRAVPASFPAGVTTTNVTGGVQGPRGVISAPDGNLYVLGGDADKIWRVAPSATPTFTEVGSVVVDGPSFGEVGPDGNLWFTAFEENKLVRMVPASGAVTKFTVGAGPWDVAFGDDGKAYVTNNTDGTITQFDPATQATATLALPTTTGEPAFIDEGPDGHLYAAGRIANVVYEITPDPPPAVPDTTPPETTITKPPKRKLSKKKARKARVEFISSEVGSTFECRVDKKPFAPCSSPAKLGTTKKGKHTFAVRSIDAAGNVDASPTEAKFKVKKKRR